MGTEDIELKAAIRFETDASASAAKKTLEDVKGSAEGAATAVNKVKPSEGTANEFKKVQGSAEKSFAAIDASRQVTEGGIMGLGQAVKNLAGQFPALTAALGPIGLALAAFSAWKTVVNALTEAHARLKAAILAINIGNTESRIKAETAAYDALYTSIKRLSEERQRYADIEQSKDDAGLRSALAKLELEKEQRYAGLSADDALGRRTIDLDISTKRSGLEEAATARASERDARTLRAKESEQTQILKTAEQEKASAEENMLSLMNQRFALISNSRKGGSWLPNKVSTAEPAIKQLDDMINAQFDASKAAEQTKYKAGQSIIEIQAARDINKTDRGTLDVKSQTRQTSDYNTGAGIDRDSNAQLDGLFSDLNAASADGSAVFRNWARDQIAAKERENALTAEFMQRMIELADQNARQIQANTERSRRQGG